VALVAREIGARLIHISTDFVFDGTQEKPRREDDIICPVNAYGKSKWEGEQRVPLACVVRTSWLFGSGGKNFLSSILSAL
jgi:dTDP-4-dehydrorhamnose reductase